jgi:hypothetical protein
MPSSVSFGLLGYCPPATGFTLLSVRDAPLPSFGLLIAYVIPGFVLLCGLSYRIATVRAWLQVPADIPSGLESALFIILASIAAGMLASAVRWCLVDSFHHWTGIARPEWDDGRLQENLIAFEAIVEAHYRYYQCHANLFVAIGAAYLCWRLQPSIGTGGPMLSDIAIVLTEGLLLAVSRDNLRKYYARSSRILSSTLRRIERRSLHVQRSRKSTAGAAGKAHFGGQEISKKEF